MDQWSDSEQASCIGSKILQMKDLIIWWHQQCMESMDSSCNDVIHSIIQGETEQEEEASIKQDPQDASLQQEGKLPCLGLKTDKTNSQAKNKAIPKGKWSILKPLPTFLFGRAGAAAAWLLPMLDFNFGSSSESWRSATQEVITAWTVPKWSWISNFTKRHKESHSTIMVEGGYVRLELDVSQ